MAAVSLVRSTPNEMKESQVPAHENAQPTVATRILASSAADVPAPPSLIQRANLESAEQADKARLAVLKKEVTELQEQCDEVQKQIKQLKADIAPIRALKMQRSHFEEAMLKPAQQEVALFSSIRASFAVRKEEVGQLEEKDSETILQKNDELSAKILENKGEKVASLKQELKVQIAAEEGLTQLHELKNRKLTAAKYALKKLQLQMAAAKMKVDLEEAFQDVGRKLIQLQNLS